MNGLHRAHQIPARGGIEGDVFSGWRTVLCYLSNPCICKWAKRHYARRQWRMQCRHTHGGDWLQNL